MDSLTPFTLGDLYYPVPVQVGSCFTEVECIGTTQSVLCFAIGICIECRDLDAMLCRCSANSSVVETG